MARNKKDIKQTQIGISKKPEKEDYLVALRSKNNNRRDANCIKIQNEPLNCLTSLRIYIRIIAKFSKSFCFTII